MVVVMVVVAVVAVVVVMVVVVLVMCGVGEGAQAACGGADHQSARLGVTAASCRLRQDGPEQLRSINSVLTKFAPG